MAEGLFLEAKRREEGPDLFKGPGKKLPQRHCGG